MGVLSFVRGLLRWAFVDVPKGICCLLYCIYFLFKCQLSLSWHYLLVGYQLLFPFLASYCRFIRQPRPPNAAPHQGSIKELHAPLPDRETAVRTKLSSIQGQHYSQELGLGKVSAAGGSVAWVRGAELGAGHSLFGGNNPSAADVVQGALGSCYLLSSLAVLAEAKGAQGGTSYLQDKLFLPTQGHKGLYGLRCFLDGKESDLWVSDELPVDAKDRKTPLFASGKEGKLWPAIGEKALATAYGSYGAIEGGSAGDALSDLTGAPYRCIRLQGADQWMLWRELREAVSHRYVMAANTSELSTEACCLYMPFCLTWLGERLSACFNRYCCFFAGVLRLAYDVFTLPFKLIDRCLRCVGVDCGTALKISSLGLVPSHAYSVLTAAQSSGCVMGLCCKEEAVLVRNPWGQQRFKYPLKNFKPQGGLDVEEGGGGQGDEGVFWMSLTHFSRYFDSLHILHLMPGAFRTAATVSLSGGWGLFELKVHKAAKGFVTMHQKRGAEAGLRLCVLNGEGKSQGGTDDQSDQAYFSAEGTRSTSQLSLSAGGSYVVMLEQLNRGPLELVLSAYFVASDGSKSEGCVGWGAVGADRFDKLHEFKLPHYNAQYM